VFRATALFLFILLCVVRQFRVDKLLTSLAGRLARDSLGLALFSVARLNDLQVR